MTPASAATAAASTALTTPWWIAPAIVSALVTLVGVMFTLVVNGRRGRVERQRQLFAEAFGDIATYREFPYIVRRRRHDEPEAERVRISSELSAVQQRLYRHRATLQVESQRVTAAYARLLYATRLVAGAEIRAAWNAQPITADSAIHVTIDLSEIDRHEAAYLVEVRDHLALTPAALRRTARWCKGVLRATQRLSPSGQAAVEPAAVP